MSDFKRVLAVALAAVVVLAVGLFAFRDELGLGSGPAVGPGPGTPGVETVAGVTDPATITAEDLAQPEFAFRRLARRCQP